MHFDFLTSEQNERLNREFDAALVKAFKEFSGQVEVHDIVQLDPEKTTNKTFAGRFMVVTEIKEWGVVGYIQPLEAGAGGAYYRAETGTFRNTGGKAVWVLE